MKKFFLIFALFLAGCITPKASEIITATITVTNTPTDADDLTINGTTRTWKDTVATPSTQVAIDGIGGSATNLYNHFAAYPEAGLILGFDSTNVVTLRSVPTVAITKSLSGTWGTIVLSTNTLTDSRVVRIPFSSVPDAGSTNRTYYADQLLLGLSDYASSVLELPDGSAATPSYSFQDEPDTGMYSTAANQLEFATDGTRAGYFDSSQVLQLPSGAVITGGWHTNFGGIGMTVTNLTVVNAIDDLEVNGGYFTNVGMHTITITNLTGSGQFSNPTANAGEQFGESADASGIFSTAIGNTVEASDDYAVGIGYLAVSSADGAVAIGHTADATTFGGVAIGAAAQATGYRSAAYGTNADASETNTVAVGYNAAASGVNSTALGTGASATAEDSVAIGQGATSAYVDSTAIGTGVTATKANEVRIGTSSEEVEIPGNLNVGGVYYSPDVQDTAFKRFDNTSLSTGNNAAVNLSTNTFVRISSGPAGNFTINGIAGGRDGRMAIIYNATGNNMTIAHDSGTDPTPANRIYVLDGLDHTTTGNGAATLIYDSAASRWILVSVFD